jgi:uncharacterized protein (TIGR02466 family)
MLGDALALRADQRLAEAEAAAARAMAAHPDDPLPAFLHAQLRYERGFPAADALAAVRARMPGNADVVRLLALALAAEGQGESAERLLTGALAADPLWLEGHRLLTAQRWASGERADHDRSYAAAARAKPQISALWLAWFSAAAQARDWPRAAMVLTRAAGALGDDPALLPARAVAASEGGDYGTAQRLFGQLPVGRDPVLGIARLRLALRTGDLAGAAALIPGLLAGLAARQAWPYAALVWRLTGDRRAAWLDGDPPYVAQLDLGMTAGDLAALADQLRSLHRPGHLYAEQSVEGGTQTDRSLLLRHEPLFAQLRQRFLDAAAHWIALLPPPDPAHPLLGAPRGHLRIAGSWSVRFTGSGGYNRPHTHPHGWISSAFYVTAPEPQTGDASAAGHLLLGAPPPELELDLAPYASIAPVPGRLVLFPSTMWHATAPYAAGERLNIAFDVIGT